MRPALVISLDQEFIWGSFDHTAPSAFVAAHPDPRGTVRALLEVFDEFDVPVTWAIVGHLFLESCARGDDGRAHPEITRPRYDWYPGDWLGADPCTDRTRDPLFYGDDVLDMVQGARAKHEIACHSFSHLVYGDPGCSAAAAEADLKACVEAAARRGITLRSFVFPRNREGHHELLRRHGFTSFRGEEPAWWRDLPGAAKRAGHLFDQATARPPPIVTPSEKLPGLWNIPGSLLLLHRHGVRRYIPFAARKRRIVAGLSEAVRQGGIFHLWFHPHNLSFDRDGLFRVLRGGLREAARLRDRGVLDVCPMGTVTQRLAASAAARAA
jgi:peptidoglycan/xylan/chitin deacetylase (PgdA/CDA1 family)